MNKEIYCITKEALLQIPTLGEDLQLKKYFKLHSDSFNQLYKHRKTQAIHIYDIKISEDSIYVGTADGLFSANLIDEDFLDMNLFWSGPQLSDYKIIALNVSLDKKVYIAELNDIYNCLELGANGLVLAAETAIGNHPIESVDMLRTLIKCFQYLR